jgi:hypothetical protein
MLYLPLTNRVTKSASLVAAVVTVVMAIALRVVLALAPVLAMLPLLMAATSPQKQQTL